MTGIFRSSAILAALAIAVAAAPVAARPIATTSVVSCGAGDCLLVRGHRSSPRAVVSINERPVDARGRTSWQVRLPIETVREWSALSARTLRIAVAGPAGAVERSEAVRLPVGLLGRKVELASLVVRAR